MERIRDSINKVIDSITLQDMVDDYRRLNQKVLLCITFREIIILGLL